MLLEVSRGYQEFWKVAGGNRCILKRISKKFKVLLTAAPAPPSQPKTEFPMPAKFTSHGRAY